MPYVQRDGSGNIIAVYGAEQDKVKEFVANDDPSVVEFLDPKKFMERSQQQQQQKKADEDNT